MKVVILFPMSCLFSFFCEGQNVGINNTNPSHAKLEINGSVGATVAIFGADKNGVAIEADNPEIGLNYFYNNGQKTIKAGYASVIGMSPATGELYIGNFNGNQSAGDFGSITGYRQNLTLFQNGEFRIAGSSNFSHFYFGSNEDTYIRGGKNSSNVVIGDGGGRTGVGVYPQRAGFEQNGVVGNTAAIFGGEGTGVSFQRDWPAIGLNHYYDGAHRVIGDGWAGQLAMNPVTGTLQWSTSGFNYLANQNVGNMSTVFAITYHGDLGIGFNNINPQARIHIIDESGFSTPTITRGIRIDARTANGTGYFPWNIFVDNSVQNGWMSFGYNGARNAAISPIDGTYWNSSDRNLKKEIHNLPDNMLQKISTLRSVTYLMKNEEEGNPVHYGFIAQEIEKVFPELVSGNEQLRMMNYTGLIPVLTKGMQEQQQQIEELRKEVLQLKLALETKK